MLARLSNLSDAEVELYGPLPPAHKKRRRATIGSGSCFRLEPLPPGPGDCHPSVFNNLGITPWRSVESFEDTSCFALSEGSWTHWLGRMQLHLERQSAVWSAVCCWWLPSPSLTHLHAPEWLC